MNSYAHWQKENDYQEFLESLQTVINKKYSAKYRYRKMINDARTNAEADIIRTIIDDELKHYVQLTSMYHTLTGRKPNPDISREWLEEEDRVCILCSRAEKRQFIFGFK